MPYRFKKHYTLAAARAMLPTVSAGLAALAVRLYYYEMLSMLRLVYLTD